MVMPDGITGRDLVEKLQAKRPGLKFIYTSGYSPNGTKERESLLEGINFLQKPYGPRKLLEAVRERLDGTPRSN
jgi:DNA-binding NtrC family response regulator